MTEGFPRMIENTENLSVCSSKWMSVNCSCYQEGLRFWVLLSLCNTISPSAPTPRQLMRVDDSGAIVRERMFLCCTVQTDEAIPLIHTHLFQVCDSFSTAFSFRPGSHHKAPAVAAIHNYRKWREPNTGLLSFFFVSSEVMFFPFACVYRATTEHRIT